MVVRSRQVSPLRPAGSLGADIVTPEGPEEHPAIHEGRVAVITGAASGIGLAAAKELAKENMRIVLADVDARALESAGREIKAIVGDQNVMVVPTDVSRLEDVLRLKDAVLDAWGEVAVLLNNAGISRPTSSCSELENWKEIMDVNFWGVVHVQHTFVPAMIHQENPTLIITTGSKQGITNPPGNPAYNASKAAIKSMTEGLAHELRGKDSKLTAHLFIPGWTHTNIGRPPQTNEASDSEDSTSTGENGSANANGKPTKTAYRPKPAGAWSATETVQYMLARVRAGDFYILCPDNETSHELDVLRIKWAAEDLTEGRVPLSRWHPEYKTLFEEYVKSGLQANGHH